MGLIISPALSELIPAPCPDCEGEGQVEDGYCNLVACHTCDATGFLEVCPDCRHVPTVAHGVEVCKCSVVLGAPGGLG